MDMKTSWLYWGEVMIKMLRASCSDMSMIWTEKGDKKALKQSDNYTIQQAHDRFAGMEYVECWGQLDEEHFLIIGHPLESIRESVAAIQ